ncbi:putative Type 2 DNA topoisomerase 6 subunit B-like protein [Helianthus anomalus]
MPIPTDSSGGDKLVVGIELIVDKGKFIEHQCVNAIVANECIDLPSEENDACLKPGLMDYALKHGNQKNCKCYSCFPTREHLKTGSGVVCRSKKEYLNNNRSCGCS